MRESKYGTLDANYNLRCGTPNKEDAVDFEKIDHTADRQPLPNGGFHLKYGDFAFLSANIGLGYIHALITRPGILETFYDVTIGTFTGVAVFDHRGQAHFISCNPDADFAVHAEQIGFGDFERFRIENTE